MVNKKIIISIIIAITIILVVFSFNYQKIEEEVIDDEYQKIEEEVIDERYLENPKFCNMNEDCISYTNCNNNNEPRNIYYDNSLTPGYNSDQKCSQDSFAYAGTNVKCQDNICKYMRCYPLFDTSCGGSGGICAGTQYASECTRIFNKQDCELIDIFNNATRSFANGDGTPDCEWK